MGLGIVIASLYHVSVTPLLALYGRPCLCKCQDFGLSRIRFVFHALTSGFGITL